MLEALREIRAALEGISGSYSKTAKRNADAAFAAASAEKLDKDEVGGALESALEAAKKSAEFIRRCGDARPVCEDRRWLARRRMEPFDWPASG